MSFDLITDGTLSNDFATIQDTPVASTSDRVAPNQVSSGVTRGSQVTINSTGIPQVLSGNQQTFGAGFYVTKPTIDVTTNKDPANFIFNSNQNVFKIAKIMTVTVTDVLPGSGASSVVSTTPHGLTFLPSHAAFISLDSSIGTYLGLTVYNAPNPCLIFGTGASTLVPQVVASVQVDATNVYFYFQTTISGAATFVNSAKVYLLQETAT